ncbi:MAG: helix-turn-helix transcriptional regulator [Treponema bryantii]|nr:helix-turn-helix transcriptional regulator [Treponema bryantii]
MNNSEVRKLFGYNLKRLRKQKKISQIELSEKVDLAFTFISDIENGKKWVSPETIEKLSKFLDVEVYQFFLPEDYVFQEDKSIKNFANEINESIRKIELRYLGK